MKYEINLLPPDAISARMEKIQVRRETTLVMASLASCLIILFAYGAMWWSLRILQQSFTDQIVLQNKDRTTIAERTKEVNREISLLDSRIASYTLWTPHIPDVVLAAPKGITISRLELVEETETLVVTGTASQGSEVVAYQAALEQLPWVDHVVAPLQNFARAPQAFVTFTIFHKKGPSL